MYLYMIIKRVTDFLIFVSVAGSCFKEAMTAEAIFLTRTGTSIRSTVSSLYEHGGGPAGKQSESVPFLHIVHQTSKF